MKLKSLKVGFNEVEDIAEHMISQKKGKQKSRVDKYAIVKDLMKHKMNNAETYLRQVEQNRKESKLNLSTVIREGTIVRREFMDLVDTENENEESEKQVDKPAIYAGIKGLTKEQEQAGAELCQAQVQLH